MDKYENLHLITSCEVCGNERLSDVLNLGLHPMCDDLVAVGDSRVCKEYPIEILFCQNCFTAHQKYQIPKNELFPQTYHYRSRFTADVLNGMRDLVSSCENEFGSLVGKKILDIGCNDGSLLDMFRLKGALTFGIEPTGAYEDAEKKGHVVTNKFFSREVATDFVEKYGKMDFVSFTNVFAHIEDLREVIESLKIAIHEGSVIVIENHYLGSVLGSSQFDTFYHEHPRTYSCMSFIFIANSLGLDLINVQFPSRYGGNIRVYLGKSLQPLKNEQIEEVLAREKQFENQFALMNKKIDQWKKVKNKFVSEYTKGGKKLKAKAFPGRAAILVKLLSLSEKEIECVYEKPGSMKIGHYLPGTRIPIFSDDKLFIEAHKDEVIFNLAWHIHGEIKKYLTEHGLTGELVDILSKDDIQIT